MADNSPTHAGIVDEPASNGDDPCEAAWNPPELLQVLATDGRATLIPELIAMFKSDAESRWQMVEKGMASGNLRLIRAQIHSLKGCAIQMGAGEMAAICERIELADSGTLTPELCGQLKELNAAYKSVLYAMEAYVREC